MDSEWKKIVKNKQQCNIRSCYTCNKNFVSVRAKETKKRKMIKNVRFEKVIQERRTKSQGEKYCKLECVFCLEILVKIGRMKELQEKEIGEKEAESEEILKLCKVNEEEKEDVLEHEKYFNKRSEKFSILDRVKIVGMTK